MILEESEARDFVDAMTTSAEKCIESCFVDGKVMISSQLDRCVRKISGIYDVDPIQGYAYFDIVSGISFREWAEDTIMSKLYMKNYRLTTYTLIEYESWVDDNYDPINIVNLTSDEISAIRELNFNYDADDDGVPINCYTNMYEPYDDDPNMIPYDIYRGYSAYGYESDAWNKLEKMVLESKGI